MPLYEFSCTGCGKEFELLVRSSNWEGTACPHCGAKKLTKKFSVFASQAGGTSSPASSAGQACARPGGCGCHGPHHHH